jgi:hypothetical protein
VAAAKLVTPGAKSSEGLDLEQVLPVVSGITYRISAYVKGNAGGESLQLVVGDATVGSATKSFAATTGFQRIDVNLTAAASGNTGVAVRTNGTAAVTFWVDAVLWEKSETLNPYFPTAAQLEAGIATWTGASNESASNLLSGPGGRINRLVVMARRNDVEVEADANVTDKHQIEVLARERFLAPR